MNKGLTVIVLLIAGSILIGAAPIRKSPAASVKTLPPAVIKTVPQAGDTNVDPNLSEIRVTFSKDMMTKESWSWVIQSGVAFPQITGKIRFLKDKRTCVAPVKLDPGTTYAIWLNSADHKGFRDTEGNPAVWYLLVFQTRK